MRKPLVDLLRGGSTITAACQSLGLSERTVQSWLSKGRRGERGFAAFAAEVDGMRERVEAGQSLPDGPMSEDELRVVVSRAAARGSVQAQKLYWEMIRGKPKEEKRRLSRLDELAARRHARG